MCFCWIIWNCLFTNICEHKTFKNIFRVLFLAWVTSSLYSWQSLSLTTWPQKFKTSAYIEKDITVPQQNQFAIENIWTGYRTVIYDEYFKYKTRIISTDYAFFKNNVLTFGWRNTLWVIMIPHNFINMLNARFLYESALGSFPLVMFWLWRKDFGEKNAGVKCWWIWPQIAVNYSVLWLTKTKVENISFSLCLSQSMSRGLIFFRNSYMTVTTSYIISSSIR